MLQVLANFSGCARGAGGGREGGPGQGGQEVQCGAGDVSRVRSPRQAAPLYAILIDQPKFISIVITPRLLLCDKQHGAQGGGREERKGSCQPHRAFVYVTPPSEGMRF